MRRQSIRGAGTDRAGANDTTVLIWKVIDANPGITRDEIIAKVRYEIPAGWALRRYASQATRYAGDVDRARRFVVTQALSAMASRGRISKDARSKGYVTVTPITRYRGDANLIDETGAIAAEHLNGAYALRIAEQWLERGSSRLTRAERQAVERVIRAHRRCGPMP